jgi:hypothetical protein
MPYRKIAEQLNSFGNQIVPFESPALVYNSAGRMEIRAAFVLLSWTAASVSPAGGQALEWVRQFGTTADERVYGVSADAGAVYAVGQTSGVLLGQTGG